jgi:hypothetical protein
MTTATQHQEGRKPDDDQGDRTKVVIHVNERPVRLEKRNVTGFEIKQAAISQGVPIQQNFLLMKELGGGRTEVVGDADRVKVDDQSRFVAVHPDDNS